ncbi:MAG: tRNA (adenosine(37)-N6)-threonylcarbamoyltransferase complex transferase subunit TsaD [Gemmatimonadota bacterium]
MKGRRDFTDGPVLGVETSCDETSAAVLIGSRLAGHVILSQDAHERFGGIVPEIAARAHLRQIDDVVAETLAEAGVRAADIDAVGVTAGPGLIGALLVGLNWAKGFAYALGRPLVGVHHMEAHLYANSLAAPEVEPPFVALLVSGGHTMLLHARRWGEYRLLGETRDDAVGEAFDKVARTFGLGFPGGPEIERVARQGRPGRFRLPRPMTASTDHPGDPAYLEFSFSGLKTAAALLAGELLADGGPRRLEQARPDLAAEFQEAVVDVLVTKTRRAVDLTKCARVLLGGGVSRNGRLRERLAAELSGLADVHAPPPRLATDNAAMVACVARFRLLAGERSDLSLNADPAYPFPGLVPSITWGTTCIRN